MSFARPPTADEGRTPEAPAPAPRTEKRPHPGPYSPRTWNESDFAPPSAESVAAPATVTALFHEIDGDPYNIRERLPSIEPLARSIYMHTLLENLLVVEHPRAAETGKLYELRAGSRRFEAIRRLIEGVTPPQYHPDREKGILWYWPVDRPIPVRVLGSEGHYEHLVENIERSAPEPWEVGRRINEALGAVPVRELSMRLGRSMGWVHRYSHIGKGLAPELIALLHREHVELKLGELSQLASIRDSFGDPDGAGQIEAYRHRRKPRRKKPRRLDPSSFRAALKRLQYLRSDMIVPAVLRPTVVAVVDYLETGTAPGFRQLETALFEKLRLLSPHTPEET